MEEPITGAKTFPEPEFPELATGTLPPAVLPDLMLALAEAMAFPAAGTGVLLVATDEVFPATIAELVLVPAEERPLPLPAAAICVLAGSTQVVTPSTAHTHTTTGTATNDSYTTATFIYSSRSRVQHLMAFPGVGINSFV